MESPYLRFFAARATPIMMKAVMTEVGGGGSENDGTVVAHSHCQSVPSFFPDAASKR